LTDTDRNNHFFFSGGIKIAVVGQRLEMVQRAEFFVEVGDKKITSVSNILRDIKVPICNFYVSLDTLRIS
jgi:hypothetical protein